ncbi:MAG: cytochrome c peroxidase, partial [Syntrophobacteraceae bacterium]
MNANERIAAKLRVLRFAPPGPRRWRAALLTAVLIIGLSALNDAGAQNFAAPPSLKMIPVPEPANLGQFVKSKAALIVLGKALYWDMQVGSDAIVACATCHFNAGADGRTKNQVNPGLMGGDTTFQSIGPNQTLVPGLFPFTQFANRDDRMSPMIKSWNDVISSAGVYKTNFAGLRAKGAVERGIPVPDPIFNHRGVNTRQVPPRNTPTVINAVFNVNNFWDGRADNIFNGSSPFGDADPNAGIWLPDENGILVKQRVRIPYSSLASQAVAPPLNPSEMTYAGRTFPDIGKKLLRTSLVPLAKQRVHPKDSVLGPLARKLPLKGIRARYASLVRTVFHDQYWNSTQTVYPLPPPRDNEGFTQMEANFSLFFGLAIQGYLSTLVSDDSPYDRFMEGDITAMSYRAQQGLNIFVMGNEPGVTGGNCIICHDTSTFSAASVMHTGSSKFGESMPEGIIERMIMGDFGGAWYDNGYYNVAVRPIEEDPGRGRDTPFTLDDGTPIPLSFTERAMFVHNGGSYPFPSPPLPCGPGFRMPCSSDQRVAIRGTFKVPTLRNVELTGPYLHQGGEATL